MESFVQVLIQGGAVGVAIAALGLVYKIVTNHNAHTDVIIQKNSDSHVKAAETSVRLASAIESLEKTLHAKLK